MLAAIVGVCRTAQNLGRGHADTYRYVGNGWDVSIEGALGELAAAKYLNRATPHRTRSGPTKPSHQCMRLHRTVPPVVVLEIALDARGDMRNSVVNGT